jgi:hypothetical protein
MFAVSGSWVFLMNDWGFQVMNPDGKVFDVTEEVEEYMGDTLLPDEVLAEYALELIEERLGALPGAVFDPDGNILIEEVS